MGIHYFALIITTFQSVVRGCSNGYELVAGQHSVIDIDDNEADSLNGIPMETIIPQEAWNIVATFAPCSALCAVSSVGKEAFMKSTRFRTKAIDHKFEELMGVTPDCKSPMDFEHLHIHRPVLIDNLRDFKFDQKKLLEKTADDPMRWKGIETNTDTPFLIAVLEASRTSKQNAVTNTWPRRTTIQKLAVVTIKFEGEGSNLEPIMKANLIDCDISHCVFTNPLMASRLYENGCTTRRWSRRNLAWYLETGSLTLPESKVTLQELSSRRLGMQRNNEDQKSKILLRKRIIAFPAFIFLALAIGLIATEVNTLMLVGGFCLGCGLQFFVLVCIV